MNNPVAFNQTDWLKTVPFGAGSSVEGHISTPCSGLSIDFVKMDKIIQFHPDE